MSKKAFTYEDSFGNIEGGYGSAPVCGFKVQVAIDEHVSDADFKEIDDHTEAIEAIIKKYAKKIEPRKKEEEEDES